MDDLVEVLNGIFAFLILGFILFMFVQVGMGRDIAGLVNVFAQFAMWFIIAFVIMLIGSKVWSKSI